MTDGLPRSSTAPAAAATAGEAGQADDTFQTSIYLSGLARGAARRASVKSGRSIADIAIDAVDWALEEGVLQALVERQHITPRNAGSAFPARRTARATRDTGENRSPKVPLQAFFTAGELAVLDELKSEYEVRSRSVVLRAAIEAYFFPPTHKEMQALRHRNEPPPVDLDA